METKVCSRCGEEKELSKFYKNVAKCKSCYREYQEEMKATPKYQEKLRQYREKTREQVKKRSKEYYHNLPEQIKKQRNKEQGAKARLKLKNYPEKVEKLRLRSLEYEKQNYDKRRIQRAITRKARYWSDLNYRMEILLRTRFYKAVKRGKVKSILLLIGCSTQELRDYLEKMFLPEMNWENYGKVWDIDHILPCASFDLNKIEDQEKCFHYSNCQPLFKTTKIAQSLGYQDLIGNIDKKDKILK